MKRKVTVFSIITLIILAVSQLVFAGGENVSHGLEPAVLVGVAVIMLAAKLFAEIFERLNQPGVLGELVAGIVLGNLFLVGITAAEPLKTNAVIEALAQIGVIILLFEVGIETNFKELRKVGLSALSVAVIGVVAPFLLGWLVAFLFLSSAPTLSHIFIGAMLAATSIGITARVLRDLGRLNDRVARIILGAAVIDDILALLVLAIVEGVIEASASGTPVDLWSYVLIAGKAIGFVIAAILAGQFFVPMLFRGVKKFKSEGIVLGLAISICFLTAFAASQFGLAAIIGAFAAGLMLDEVPFENLVGEKGMPLDKLISPIAALLAPIFFVAVGMKVNLLVFGDSRVLFFALALTLAAIVGKQACSLGVREKDISKKAVGFGMIPRGEVVLFFASFGTMLFLAGADGVTQPVISASTYSAVVIMVMITTLMTPFLLKWALGKKERSD